MRVLRKVAMGASVSALALAVAGGVYAKPANAAGSEDVTGSENQGSSGTATASITLDQELAITPSSDAKAVFVSFDAVKKDKYNAKALWNAYDPKSVTTGSGSAAKEAPGSESTDGSGAIKADLSSLNTAKEIYIAVKADTSAPIVYHIAAPEKAAKIKGTYQPASHKIDFGSSVSVGDLQYRTAVGDWKQYSGSVDLTKYEQQGATLYFRVKAKTFTAGSAVSKDNGNYSQVELTGGAFAGKEFKVKIAKKAKGPSLKIDYVKGTITKPKNPVLISKSLGSGFNAMDKDETLVLNASNGAPLSGVIQVKTAATEKKAESNPTVISYKGTADPVSANIEVTYTKGKADGKGTVTFTNKSTTDTYLIYLSGDEAAAKPKALATIKPTKTTKVAQSKITKDLKFAVAADAKTGKFQSRAVDYLTKATIDAALKVGEATSTNKPSGSETLHNSENQ